MRYDDTVTFSRAADTGGAQDPVTGAFTPAAPTVLYAGPCDAQDVKKVLARDAAGLPILVGDVGLFLPWGSWPAGLKLEDLAAIVFADGAMITCKVVSIRHLDRVIWVKQ